jgi:hypothetical protein
MHNLSDLMRLDWIEGHSNEVEKSAISVRFDCSGRFPAAGLLGYCRVAVERTFLFVGPGQPARVG